MTWRSWLVQLDPCRGTKSTHSQDTILVLMTLESSHLHKRFITNFLWIRTCSDTNWCLQELWPCLGGPEFFAFFWPSLKIQCSHRSRDQGIWSLMETTPLIKRWAQMYQTASTMLKFWEDNSSTTIPLSNINTTSLLYMIIFSNSLLHQWPWSFF